MLLGTDRDGRLPRGGARTSGLSCVGMASWGGENVKRLDVKRGELTEVPLFLDSAVVEDLAGGKWNGYANRLSG